MTITDDVRQRLSRVRFPGYERDIVTLGIVRDVHVHDDVLHVDLTPGSTRPEVLGILQRDIESALADIAGTRRIDVRVPQPTQAGAAPRSPFDERAPLPGVASILAVASGKGGVGKSTVAVNLALALRAGGRRVGLLDADIHGPSVPLMLGIPEARPTMAEQKKIFPIERYGLSVISMGFFLDDTSPVIWRGPMVMSIVRQFLKDVVWGELDVLVVDLPPGTGDAQLTLMQQVPVSGGVIVTTPQDVALQDVARGIAMFQAVQAPVIGIVENMSFYACPRCGTRESLFGAGGGRREAETLGIELLGEVPLVAAIRASMDEGDPIVVRAPADPISTTFATIADRVAEVLGLEAPRASRA